jgi:hypothetical protein
MLLSGCIGDTVSHTYSDLAELKAEHIIEKGWLPDNLPASSRNIKTRNNLDLSTSTGSFEFLPKDSAAFYSQLSTGAPEEFGFDDWDSTVKDYANDGYKAWTLGGGRYTWVFFCSPSNDRCDYFLR